jgi:hypothetical protein
MAGDFEAMARVALGTDDPERLAAFKEAVMACMSSEESGEYEGMGEEMASGTGASMKALFGGGGKKA